MDVEPFLVASVLEGILAQRLGRCICQHCKAPIPLDEAVKHRLSREEHTLFKNGMSFKGTGCEKCDNTGQRGRIGYYEVLTLTSAMRVAITDGRTSRPEIIRTAAAGHVSMRQDGVIKAAQGLTTIEEVLRATQDADDISDRNAAKAATH
jgi:type IV pilus assembly protein PilB